MLYEPAVSVVSMVRHTCLFFFFSSRRRHTRLQGDWSSDVCSSDLQAGAEYVAPLATKGMALDIDKYLADWGQKDDFYESAWSTVAYQGKTYGIPILDRKSVV